MTPSLFDLPLRLGDAAALAAVLFEQREATQPKPLTDDFRARLASRIGALRFESMWPLPASLERDPIHPSAFYLCVDGIERQPLLLRIAPASTPSSGIFPNAILIGRAFIGPREAVLNAIPFGPSDRDRIMAFAGQINPVFLPKAPGSKPVILVHSPTPAETFPLAFEGFRKLLRATGHNMAAFASADDPSAVVWSAIRSGWREGYVLAGQAGLNVTREIHLDPGISRDDALVLFAAGTL